MSLARKFLRPVRPDDITVIESKSSGQELQVQVRGYIEQPMQQLVAEHPANASIDESAEKEDTSGTKVAIAGHLYKVLRGITT